MCPGPNATLGRCAVMTDKQEPGCTRRSCRPGRTARCGVGRIAARAACIRGTRRWCCGSGSGAAATAVARISPIGLVANRGRARCLSRSANQPVTVAIRNSGASVSTGLTSSAAPSSESCFRRAMAAPIRTCAHVLGMCGSPASLAGQRRCWPRSVAGEVFTFRGGLGKRGLAGGLPTG